MPLRSVKESMALCGPLSRSKSQQPFRVNKAEPLSTTSSGERDAEGCPTANAATHPLLHFSTPQQLTIILSLAPRSMPAKIMTGTDETKWRSIPTWMAVGYASAEDMKKDIELAQKNIKQR